MLVFVLDDVGFGQLSSFGGLVETPVLDSVADNGLRYTNMHTTARCSPPRGAILIGRDHHWIGLATISETSSGYPGYNAILPFNKGMLGDMLLPHGDNTFMVGKCASSLRSPKPPGGPRTGASPIAGDPSRRGFRVGHSTTGAGAQYGQCVESPSVLLPIPGDLVDPPVRDVPERVRVLESRGGFVGTGVSIGMRTSIRFTHSRATLLAAGTTYYLFLSLFAVVTLAYGLTATLGAERFAAYVTEALAQAFPGLLDESGIDPEELRTTGQAASIVSAVGLLYGSTGAVLGASRSLHAVYGAPENTRNIVVVRLWALGWFFVLGPLVLASFVSVTLTANVWGRLFDALGVHWDGPTLLLGFAAFVLTMALNFLVMHLILGRLGGIRPARVPRLVGAMVGAVVIEVLKQVMGLLVGFVIDKPQYGALAAPIGIMFVLYLQTAALYTVASLTAALAEVRAERQDSDQPFE